MSEENWKDSLPENLREAPYFKNAESVDQVLADLTNAAQWQGNSIRIPGPDAGEDDQASFREKVMEKIPGLMPTPNLEDPASVLGILDKLGRPDSPEGYTVPDGVDIDAAQLKAQAHAAGLTASQFNSLLTALNTDQATAMEAAKNALDADYVTLKTEWGAAYESKMGDISNLLAEAPESVRQAFESGTIPTEQLRWLDRLSALGDENAQMPSQKSGRDVVPTPEEALHQLPEVTKRLFDPNTPAEEKAALNLRRMKLIALANGETELPPMRLADG